MIGLYISLRKKKGDPFYGRFQNDGWNTHGTREGAVRTGRSGRKTAPGKTDVPGKQFVHRGFELRKNAAVDLIVRSVESGSEVVKRKVGLR
jgi:hypothetical protein